MTFGPIGVPEGGWAVRARAATRAFASLGFAVTVVCVGGGERTGDTSGLGEDELVVLPGGNIWHWALALARTAWRMRKAVDAFVVESALLLVPVAFLRRPIVWDTTECESLHYRRLSPRGRTRLKATVWHVLELLAGLRCAVLVAISNVEAKVWIELFPFVAPKVVVVEHQPEVGGLRGQVCEAERPLGRFVLFVGNLAAKHNQAAARWCADELGPRLPHGVKLVLAGRGTEEFVARAAAPPNVVGLGFVEGIDELIANATLCVAPLLAGAGVKTKVLHYLALGQAVIGTPVAFEGIEDGPRCEAVPLELLAELVVRRLEGHMAGNTKRGKMSEVRGPDPEHWRARHLDGSVLQTQWAAALARVVPAPENDRCVLHGIASSRAGEAVG